MPDKCLPDSLKGQPHTDWKAGWLRILSWVPRSWTAWCGWAWPQPPWRILGNSGWTGADQAKHPHHSVKWLNDHGHVMPIPKAGHWVISSVPWLKFLPIFPMFAITFKTPADDPDYFSLGVARWDDIDNYYDILRVRAHGKKGRILMIGTGLSLAGALYLIFG